MSKSIPTKLFLPKQLFSSLTDWIKANYTSWGWKNATVNPKDWTINDGITLTRVDSSTFSFRGFDTWSSCGVGRTESLIMGVHALVKCPKSTPFIKVLIGTTDIQKAHTYIYPAFSDSAYNYFVIDTDKGFSRFYPNEASTDWMDVRFFDPYIVLKSHLKPISVGDKLGLVYWDGWIPEEGKSYNWLMTTSNPDWQFVYLSNASYWPKGLGVVKNGGIPSKVLLKDKGTVSLSSYNFTVASSDISVMQNHIWHVI